MIFTLLLGNMGSVFATTNSFADSSPAMRITLNDSETTTVFGGSEIILSLVRVYVVERSSNGKEEGISNAKVYITYENAVCRDISSGDTWFGNFIAGIGGFNFKDGLMVVTVVYKDKTQVQKQKIGGIRTLFFKFTF